MEFLKWKAVRVMNQHTDRNSPFKDHRNNDKFDALYGLEESDYGYIEQQIINCRSKKGRGLLIPLNTYNETKMYDLVRKMLESKKIALVSDAGMPCISDPGWKLVDHIRTKMPEVQIEVLGGPCSVGVMTLLGNITQKQGNLSGRFEGFADP